MAMILRQSTASQEILLGPFVDSADGNTAETALSIANTDIKLFKEGATTLADKNSGGATHISNGYYYAVLDATDTGTVGQLEVNVKVAGALAVRREFQVVKEAVYDALFASSAAGYQVPIWAAANSTVNLSATTVATVTTTTTATNVTTVNGLAANVITATSINADAITAAKIANGAIDAATFAADVDAEILSYLVDDATRIDASALNTATVTTIPTNLDATVSSRSTVTTAQVNTEVDTALADVRLDELLAADSDIDGAAPPTVGSVFHELMTKTAGSFTYDQTTDSLEAVRDRGDSAWITATGFSTHSASDVWAVGTRVLTAATNISGPIADQVWEEAIADHSGTAGSTAEALNAAGSAGDPWTTTLPGSYTGSQAGKILADVLVDTGTTLQAELDGIQADTEDIQTRLPAALVGGRIDATVDATGLEVGALALINAEVDTALADYAPATAANLATVAGYLDTEIAAILADTNELQTDWTNGGRLDLLIDAIKAKTDVLTFSNTNHIYADVRSLLGQVTITESDRFTGL